VNISDPGTLLRYQEEARIAKETTRASFEEEARLEKEFRDLRKKSRGDRVAAIAENEPVEAADTQAREARGKGDAARELYTRTEEHCALLEKQRDLAVANVQRMETRLDGKMTGDLEVAQLLLKAKEDRLEEARKKKEPALAEAEKAEETARQRQEEADAAKERQHMLDRDGEECLEEVTRVHEKLTDLRAKSRIELSKWWIAQKKVDGWVSFHGPKMDFNPL
jgi:hypothetical protein